MASCFSRPATRLKLVDEQTVLPSPRDWEASEETQSEEKHTVVTSVYPGDFPPADRKLSAQPWYIPEKEPGGQYTGRKHMALKARVGPQLEGRWVSDQVCRSSGLAGINAPIYLRCVSPLGVAGV